ncbi:hypothetical protein MWU50_11505 [Flavobacteriaceae bacterium S0862]|nr:hypothetical protein [Flavobacteriaceae bacterium S0862]
MKKNLEVLFVNLLIFSSCLIWGQQTRIELGDRYFNHQAFEKAKLLYLNANKTRIIYAKLGDCYYYTSNPEVAVKYYDSAFAGNNNSSFLNKYRLRYALSLLSNGRQNSALIEFKKLNPNNENLETRKIDTSSNQVVENLITINSENSDFGSYIYNDTLYYASSRLTTTSKKEKKRNHNKKLYKWNEHPYLDLYSASIERNNNADIFTPIHSDNSIIGFNTYAHEASIAIVNDNEMYFSGGIVNKKNKIIYNKRGVSNLKIQKAKRQGTKWVLDSIGTKALDFINLENYSIGNPTLSPDKKRMFFVSCAPYPEAKGQSDIYYVDIDGDKFGKVKSVPIINTNGRESFPFISSSGDLYFSSDGFYNNKLGFGLLDIYKVENINEFIEMINKKTAKGLSDYNEFEKKIIHMGSPFNSNKDDFAFYLDEHKDINNSPMNAFFSSNRKHPDAKGNDDIYRVKLDNK